MPRPWPPSQWAQRSPRRRFRCPTSGWTDMKQWFERHVQTLVGSLGRLFQKPFATLLTVVVIGVALALPACLEVLVQNVRSASGGWNNALDISVYMKPAA